MKQDMVNMVIHFHDGHKIVDGAFEQGDHKDWDSHLRMGIAWMTDIRVKSISFEKD